MDAGKKHAQMIWLTKAMHRQASVQLQGSKPATAQGECEARFGGGDGARARAQQAAWVRLFLSRLLPFQRKEEDIEMVTL